MENVLKTEPFENGDDDNDEISLLEFSSNTNPKWPVIAALIVHFSGVAWKENI